MAIDEHPPAQFASLTQQTKTPINHFCVVTQEYDRNIYGQCNYIANRTLMRCLQIRRKEDLAKNGGQCDRHFSFRRTLKERYDRDMILIRNNCPPQSPKSRRYTRSIKSNGLVVDQDQGLVPIPQWSSEETDHCFQKPAIEFFDLKTTKVMSCKEIDLHKMLATKKEIECLEVQKKELEGQIHPEKRKRKSLHDGVKLISQGYEKGKRSRPMKICQFGHSDEEEVGILVNFLVHTVSGEPPPVKKQVNGCSKGALIGSDFCFKHSQLGKLKPTFPKCTKCDNLIFENIPDGTANLCVVHKYENLRKPRNDFGEDIKSDNEFFDNSAKKSKKIVGKTPTFTSTNTTGFFQRKWTDKSIGYPDCARCRPFEREFFPPKCPQRPTIPFAISSRSVIRPAPAEAAARLVTLQRTQPYPPRNTTIQRITSQDRQRNRLQQEEDMKAAAAIQEVVPNSQQYKPGGINRAPQSFRPGVSTLAMNIANLPEEIKSQPLGSVLRQGLITTTSVHSHQQYGPPRPRLPVQTAVRKPDTPISSSVLTGVVRNIPVSSNVQRNQIASIDLPPIRRTTVVPPHRSIPRPSPMGSSIPPHPVSRSNAPNAPPKVIPLERSVGSAESSQTEDLPTSSVAPIADFVTQLVDEGKVPDSMINVPGPRPISTTPAVEEKPDILRKKTRPSLPLPKLPNQNRSKSRINSSETASSSAAPNVEKEEKKKEKPAPRQGQRRSSRLDPNSQKEDPSDPLSLLADVSAAVRIPEKP